MRQKKCMNYRVTLFLATDSLSPEELKREWHDCLASELLVLIPVHLEVSLVLLDRPVRHLREAHQSEEPREEDGAEQTESHPAHHLARVVGARHQLEQWVHGDWACLRPLCRAQVGQVHVHHQVSQLREQEDDGACGDKWHGRSREERAAQWVADHCAEGPVVDAVLEQIRQRHCRTGKFVHEKSLQFAFHEMQSPVFVFLFGCKLKGEDAC